MSLYIFVLSLIIVCSGRWLKPVGYQVHSWNDLSLWPNGFKQGMQDIKIDAHFVSEESFCLKQSQVTSNSSNGCFVLSHDKPDRIRQYNSTDNVLQFIQNNIDLFNSFPPFLMAICFKLDGVSPCDNSETANKWLSSVTQLMNSFTTLISLYNLTIQIVLDGSASDDNINSNQCLAHLWEPYIKTFTGNPSNPIAMSNNETLGYDRFSVLDTNVNSNECLNSFNKWVGVGFEKYNNTNKPWLWWEPNDQKCIRQLVDAYNASQFLHDDGFYFAINIDIPRFKIYSGYNTWNEPMKLTNINDKNTNKTHVIQSFLNVDNNNIVIISIVSINNDILYSISTATEIISNDLNISQWNILNDTGLNGKILTSMTAIFDVSSGDQLFAVSTQDAVISLLSINRSTLNVMVMMNEILKPPICDTFVVSVSSMYMQSNDTQNGTIFIISQLFVCDKHFGVQNWIGSNKKQSFKPTTFIPIILDYNTLDIDDVSIVVNNNNNNNNIYIALWSSKKKIYGILVDDDDNNNEQIEIGVGDKPRLSMNNDIVIEVHENSYCWISEHHLKQSVPSTCNTIPISMKGVLTYTMGSFNDWINKFKYDNNNIISVCDKYLIHAMYDGGSTPYPNIIIDSFKQKGILSIHDGITQSINEYELNQCGPPIQHNDLILDSWPI